MEKNKTPEAPKKDIKKFIKKSLKRTGFTLYLAETALLAALFAGAVFLWYNPQIIYEKIKGYYPEPQPVSEPTQPQAEVKYVIPEAVTKSISQLNEKVGALAYRTEQFMNIKADSSVVLSMAEKLNRLEQKADTLAKISNNGALILSAAVMVKESASQGLPFIYEAEILKNLSRSQPDIETEINYIYNNSSRQFASDKTLIEQYDAIYNHIIAQQEPKPEDGWKARLLHKARQYVKISEPQKQEENTYNPLKVLQEIKALADNGDLGLAVNTLDKPENQVLKDNYPELEEWYSEVRNKHKFYQAVNKISSYSLALMKAESLKNGK